MSQAQADQYLAAAELLEREGKYSQAEYHYRKYMDIEQQFHPDVSFDGISGRILDLQGRHAEANRAFSSFELHYAQERQRAQEGESAEEPGAIEDEDRTAMEPKQPAVASEDQHDRLEDVGLRQNRVNTQEMANKDYKDIGLQAGLSVAQNSAGQGESSDSAVNGADREQQVTSAGSSLTDKAGSAETEPRSAEKTGSSANETNAQNEPSGETADGATIVSDARLLRILRSIPAAQAAQQFRYAKTILAENEMTAAEIGMRVSVLDLQPVIKDYRSHAAKKSTKESATDHPSASRVSATGNQAGASVNGAVVAGNGSSVQNGVAVEDKYIQQYLSRIDKRTAVREFKFARDYHPAIRSKLIRDNFPDAPLPGYTGIACVRDLVPVQIIVMDKPDFDKLKLLASSNKPLLSPELAFAHRSERTRPTAKNRHIFVSGLIKKRSSFMISGSVNRASRYDKAWRQTQPYDSTQPLLQGRDNLMADRRPRPEKRGLMRVLAKCFYHVPKRIACSLLSGGASLASRFGSLNKRSLYREEQ